MISDERVWELVTLLLCLWVYWGIYDVFCQTIFILGHDLGVKKMALMLSSSIFQWIKLDLFLFSFILSAMPSTPYLGHPDCSSRACNIQVNQPVMAQNLEIQYRADEAQTWTSYPDSVRTWNHLDWTTKCRDLQWDGARDSGGYLKPVKTPGSAESKTKAEMNVVPMCTEATAAHQVPQTNRNVTF